VYKIPTATCLGLEKFPLVLVNLAGFIKELEIIAIASGQRRICAALSWFKHL
jgi:hypothetical protein